MFKRLSALFCMGLLASLSLKAQNQENDTLSDEQVIKVIMTANNGEIQGGQIAKKLAVYEAVKRFANMMYSDHTKANKNAVRLSKKYHLIPADSALSLSLEAKAKEKIAALPKEKSKAFDAAYIDWQVDAHTEVLDLLQNELIMSATNAELKAFIEELIPKVSAHLKKAQQIQDDLAK